MTAHELQDTLVRLERRGWASLCDGTGAQFYGETMTEDGLMVLANGAVLGRDDVVGSLENAPPWRTYEIADVRLVHISEDCAVLVYRGTGYRDGDEPAFVGAMSSVYVRRDDAWQLALYQQTPIPQ